MHSLEVVFTAITLRQHVSPKRLIEPGPDAAQLDQLFQAAAAAPDHGEIRPWRLVLVPVDKRDRLAEAFALALTDRDPDASEEEILKAKEKAYRSPLLALAIVRLRDDADPAIPGVERIVALGAALQNVMVCATAMGFGSGLTSGKAMDSPRIRTLFGLTADEQAVCFVNVGTVAKAKPRRPRPAPGDVVSSL